MKTCFLLTEGDHDAAFIYRILKAHGFKTFDKKIKEYPKPLDSFLQSDIMSVSIPEVTISAAKTRFLPRFVMKNNEEDLVFIYVIGGDSKRDVRVKLLQALQAFNPADKDQLAIEAMPNATLRVLYFFDADNKGTAARMEQILGELKEVFDENLFDENIDYHQTSTLYKFENMKIGAYIFRKQDEDNGMLEDVLIPLMQQGNEEVFDAAEQFLATNRTCALFHDKLRFSDDGTILERVNGVKYAHNKSLIGTVGQLQKSGKSNTVCISDADYLNTEKIMNNPTCNAIVDFIQIALSS